METFKIKGGFELKGEITPQGAKNEALQVICATILSNEKIIINNIPDIIDVKRLIDLLSNLGVSIEKLSSNSYSFQSNSINLDYLESDEFKKDFDRWLRPFSLSEDSTVLSKCSSSFHRERSTKS